MAQITNKRLGELVQTLFRILEKQPEGMKAKEALAALADSVTLTEYEAGSYESGRRFEKIVRFATVDTVRAGWLIKDDGIWTLTGEGAKALKLFKDPEVFHKMAAQLYRQWYKQHKGRHAENQCAVSSESEDVEDESEKSVSVSYEEAREQAQETIDAFLHAMDPYDFQKLVAELLKAIGYHVTWIAPPGKDGGVDILAYTDPLGTQGPRIKVQVKQQCKAVTEPDLKSFMANIGQHDSGIFFCTGGFTKDAEAYARSQESKRIMLVDSAKLVQLWSDNIPRLSDQAWQRLPLTPRRNDNALGNDFGGGHRRIVHPFGKYCRLAAPRKITGRQICLRATESQGGMGTPGGAKKGRTQFRAETASLPELSCRDCAIVPNSHQAHGV